MTKTNCRNLSAGERYITETLNKSFYAERKTVAPDGSNGIGIYDFENIKEALLWVKMVGAEENSTNGIELVLGKGAHYLQDNEILGSGVHVDDLSDQAVLFLRDINLSIAGEGVGATRLLIENNEKEHIRFQNMRLTMHSLSIGISAHISKEEQIIDFVGCQVNLYNIGFTDIKLHPSYGTTLRMSSLQGTSGFCSVHTNNHDVIHASMNSFVYLSGIDFNSKPKHISAVENSYIYLQHNIDDENVVYNVELNKLSHDMSLIYNHEALGVYTTNLQYIEKEDHVEIFNSAGIGFDIPFVNRTTTGLMTKEDKIKLDGIRPQAEKECLNKFAMWEENSEIDGQTTFVVRNVSSSYAKVFLNGVLVRKDEYKITFNYDNILVVFIDPKSLGDWVSIEYAL